MVLIASRLSLTLPYRRRYGRPLTWIGLEGHIMYWLLRIYIKWGERFFHQVRCLMKLYTNPASDTRRTATSNKD